MPNKNMNTQASLRQVAKPAGVLEAELARAQAESGEDMVELLVPEAFRGSFGNPMKFSVNAIEVEVILGEPTMVSKAHYLHAQRLMKGAVLTKNQKRLTPDEVYKY